jgi:hypothetical protein
MVHEESHQWFHDPVHWCRGQLRESRIRQKLVCGYPDQIPEKHAEQREATDDIHEVDAFVDRYWTRTLIDRRPWIHFGFP